MSSKRRTDGFEVEGWVHRLGGFIARNRRLWIRLGNLETRLRSDEIAATDISQPVYVSGLARAGSTILLECLARHEGTATHRYKDYPPVFTPMLWNALLARVPEREAKAAERSHQDGIKVTPESPEAFEEVLWMAFFDHLHDPSRSAVLDGRTSHPEFEAFYRDHIKKLLRVRGRTRYLSKSNYNVTRLEYLLKLFPAARFIIPVRDPSWHIASLMKQHALFCRGEHGNPRALEHLRRVGHFEFGLDRRPIHAGDDACIREVEAAWQRGHEVQGWALYWSHIHGFLADRLDASPELREASLVVRFEDLCSAPREILRDALDHARLPASDAFVEGLAATIRFPSYYSPKFSPEDLRQIERLTRDTAARFRYPVPEAAAALSA